MEIKKISVNDYERFCLVSNNKPLKNKLLRSLFIYLINKLKTSRFLYTSAYFVEADYLIISSNPIFSIFILNELKKKNITDIFIHNIYMEDNLGYTKLEKNLDLQFLVETNKDNNCIFFNEKGLTLSYFNKKLGNYFLFSNFPHSFYKIEKMFSSEYMNVWGRFKESFKNKKGWIINGGDASTGFGAFVFAKNVIIQNKNNPYIDQSIYGDKNCLSFNQENAESIRKLIGVHIDLGSK